VKELLSEAGMLLIAKDIQEIGGNVTDNKVHTGNSRECYWKKKDLLICPAP
jgi:hypothetical protein